ncbi:DNA-directed RNA polymerase, subunit L [Thermoplasmatales archaeon BRNA1]|nr:DNA-directed RNA polymerase, subunit L [Thermoplasmatales archaeon BRNA1]
MQIRVVKKEADTVRFGLKDANSTIIEPIIEFLNKDPEVVFARYIVDHPDLDDPILEVKVKSGTPEDAVKRAAESVGKAFSL